MPEIDLTFLRSLKGHNIEYQKDGKTNYGVLEDLAYVNFSEELHAHIRTTGKKSGILYRQFCIPVSNIPDSHFNQNTAIQKTREKKSQDKNQEEDPAILQKPITPRPKATESITHKDIVYTSANIRGILESGDEVIWMIPRTEKWEHKERPKGKIDFVGRSESIVCDKGKKSLGLIALVQFEQNTKGLPNFVNDSENQSKLNRNVVPLNQLVLHAHYKEILEDNNSDNSRPEVPVKPSDLKRTGSKLWETSSNLSHELSTQERFKAERNGRNSQEGKIKPAGDDEWEKIDANFLFSESPDKLKSGRFGIQGYDNSCYMDASIYSLFAFTNVLDSFIARDKERDNASVRHKLKKILRRQIVQELRTDHFVSIKSMDLMRKILEAEVSPDYRKSCMDVEEFIIDVFTLIGAPDLFEYNDKETDSIHQIILPLDWAGKKDNFMTVQELLQGSFDASDIKLARVPEKAFILKMPVSDGKLIPCNGVIPDLTLDLSNIVIDGRDESSQQLHLHAVICLRHSHFVNFVRVNRDDPKDPWVFMDSKPGISKPEVILLYNVSNIISHVQQQPGMKTDQQVICNDFNLLRDAYICIYIP